MVLESKERVTVLPSATRDRMGLMVRAMTEVGPNIAQVSSRLNIPKETLRYWYKGLIRKGFAIQAIPNYEALGLKRVVAILDFADVVSPFSDPILTAMSETAYVGSFARTMPDNLYIVNASVPEGLVGTWSDFMDALRKKGIFKSVEILTFDWVRSAPMSVQYFDFDRDRWEFDWSVAKPGREAYMYEPSPRTSFDSIDLAVIKQLQLDANKSLVEIQNHLKVNYKTLTWHWREHLRGEKLVRGYQVNWAGTRYDYDTDTPKHTTHRYLPVELVIRNLGATERMEIMRRTNSLPFLWLEASGKNYYCKTILPMESIANAMQFIGELLAPVKERASWFLMDQMHALAFSIAPSLYTPETGWTFDQNGQLAKFDELVLKIKEEK